MLGTFAANTVCSMLDSTFVTQVWTGVRELATCSKFASTKTS